PLYISGSFRLGVFHTERDAHRSSHPDGWCAAHNHGADGVCDLLIGGRGNVAFFSGQLRLIEEANTLVGPFERVNHALGVGRWSLADSDSRYHYSVLKKLKPET